MRAVDTWHTPMYTMKELYSHKRGEYIYKTHGKREDMKWNKWSTMPQKTQEDNIINIIKEAQTNSRWTIIERI